jgi:hypothetical protein
VAAAAARARELLVFGGDDAPILGDSLIFVNINADTRTCPDCGGSGQRGDEQCEMCQGAGWVWR